MVWEKTMKIQRVIGPIVGAVMALLSSGAQAADIKVLASTAVKTTLQELTPQFEKATDNKVEITFAPAAALKVKIEEGEIFDVAILAAPITDSLAASGKVDTARTTIAHSGIGVAIRKGAPKPDISTTEAFKRTLLDVKSVGFTAAGATGAYLKTLFEKLGIAEELKPKLKLLPGAAGEAAASGHPKSKRTKSGCSLAIAKCRGSRGPTRSRASRRRRHCARCGNCRRAGRAAAGWWPSA